MAGFCTSGILKVVMEEISFKGEKYVKASVIAEKLGYTADYVGQLCRSKQVDATLVGRSWYVSEKSISGHKKNRYRSTLSKSKESVRKIADERTSFRNLGYTNRKTSYDQDDSDLIPIIVKENRSVEEKRNVYDRDIDHRKLDNRPYNDDLIKSFKEHPVRVSSKISGNTTRALPPVRVISTKAVDMNTLPVKTQSTKISSVSTLSKVKSGKTTSTRDSAILSLAGWLTLLTLSMGVFIVQVSLEKRVVITDSDSEVILYNFNLEPFKALFLSYFGHQGRF